jgi:hypothetical protein
MHGVHEVAGSSPVIPTIFRTNRVTNGVFMAKEKELSRELIAAIKDIVPKVLGITFKEMFLAYAEENEGEPVKEADLLNEILDAGDEQAQEGDSFETRITTGLIAVGGLLGLTDASDLDLS